MNIEIPYVEIPYVEIPYIDIPCVDFPYPHLTTQAIRLPAKHPNFHGKYVPGLLYRRIAFKQKSTPSQGSNHYQFEPL